ncbi:MAG: hypothetical protein HGB11_09935 [Chlorobiales bacterium]|nr:hypothetical protein [Chlorobiales bacterium]
MSDEYQHPAFPPPPHPEVLLWRYLDFEKFDWLGGKRRLFMPSAQFLCDPLEGTMPDGHIERWRSLEADAASEEQRRIIRQNQEKIFAFAKAFRPHYYISCWHMNALENTKMWRCYTKSPDAVAVATSYRALRASLPAYVEIGMVRYIDYSSESLPSLNMFEYITHKNINFCFEREVRAVALPPATEGLGASHFQANHFESESQNGFHVYAPEVDVAALIDRVILHPESSPAFVEKICSACDAAGLPEPVPSAFSTYGGSSSAL